MSSKRLLAVSAAAVVTLAALVSSALAAGGSRPTVTVRVEGLSHTLLAPSAVRTKTGWITRFGAPTGKCPATSAAGALDAATKHHWVATFDKSFQDYEITSILGETHVFSSKDFWEIFVDNVAASTGSCEIGLHSGEQVLFAAVPDSKTEYPLGIRAPGSATIGHPFEATVVWFNAKGKPKPLAGATLSVGGKSGTTNSHGAISVTPSHAGTFFLNAQHAGYIRAAPLRLTVS